jgi:hypothetical protein
MSTFAQKFIFQAFKNIKGRSVVMTLPDGSTHHFGQDSQQAPIYIQVNDVEAFQWIISRGDIGVAESYFKNLWHTDDLESLLHLAIQNRAALVVFCLRTLTTFSMALIGSPVCPPAIAPIYSLSAL